MSVLDSALPVREADLRGHHLGVGVATVHSIVILKMAVHTPFPKLAHFHANEQKQELRTRLRVESQEIMFKFQQLFSTVYKCERKVSVDTLVTHLLSLGALDPVSKQSQKPLLQTFFQELRNAASIENVLWVIRDYFSSTIM